MRGGTCPAGMLIEGVGVLVNDQVVAKACNFTGAAVAGDQPGADPAHDVRLDARARPPQ